MTGFSKLASLYQGRAGCGKRQGVKAVDYGTTVTGSVIDVEIGRVLLDYVVVKVDKGIADVCDTGHSCRCSA